MVAQLAAAQWPLLQQLNVSNNKLAQQRSGGLISHHLPACLEDTEPLCQQPGCSLHFKAHTRQVDGPQEPGRWGYLHELSYHLTAHSWTVGHLQALIVQGKFGLKVAVQLLQNSALLQTVHISCILLHHAEVPMVSRGFGTASKIADHYMIWSAHRHLRWSNSFRALQGTVATA